MTLRESLEARIAASGPITLADYMADCLLHPTLGYYTTRDPFGAAGDFTTAPEISQMFGELTGLCLAQAWLDQGAPAQITLAELGPGRGTLMADLLRATRQVPGFQAALHICLVEASPTLRARQRETLSAHQITWLDDATQLPQSPLFLVANEFFDALPIRSFERHGTGWRERMIGAGLRPGLAPVANIPALQHRLHDTAQGQTVELCPSAPAIMAELATRISTHGGAALIFDYGDWGSLGDTFQALQANAFTDPFANPGQADLTAHVDFQALAANLPTAHTYTTQGRFLTNLGIHARSARLATALHGDALQSHLAATRRLTDDAEMGTLFKLLALYPHGCPTPAGTL